MVESIRRGVSETARLEAFSDGVFAIAITLLVLEIRVPPPEVTHEGAGLFRALLGLWPSYLGYLISFITIGVMWANHHSMFELICRTDRYFLLLSVLFLMCIAFLPFPTAVLAEYLPQPAGRRVAVAGYSATFVIIALAYNALWWYAVRDGRLLAPTADMSSVRTISRRYLIGPTAYFLSFLLAFVNPWASLAVHGALIVFYLLPV
ncbi:MAG TPA: TMEM175 family protein [Gemmatimonadales bacterium]|nr:TMEM175 family protein [Gemmatimonadales bacterium]